MMKIENTTGGKIILVENEGLKSEMRLGEYPKSDVYVIERHRFRDVRDNGVKTVEFILRSEDDVIFLEAKPKTSQEYFRETSEKMFDSLNKYFSFIAKRNLDTEFGIGGSDISNTRFCFYLVVRRLEKDFAENANDSFAKALSERFSKSYINIWNLDVANNSLVISYGDAQKKRLAC